jgi:hypothetical protein
MLALISVTISFMNNKNRRGPNIEPWGGDSAINQLVNISNDFGRALDSGKEIRVVFCDISKAFDRVWHKGLLFKLKQYGISGNLLVWFERYLSGRSQRVGLPNTDGFFQDLY